ncbi:APC family permease [Deinococcus maricopensis]|uniref:Amino acid permease-associated region n=1 Tax=Deinococcus maricopensis (strain DSM 21211 / LMG 22137 / NRRL B-23946 / LB-34) TaxID=709986 RepID=E8U526_DEIML|nr:APC family permease [Deinococcus maricopensis]ADV66165.1 amino acid permease-associated region [Deinococcus maricopensis DSM 21211]
MSTTTVKPRRTITPLALLFTALGSIIGSGWLFGAYNTAKIAGPAAVFAWVIGMVMMLTIALTYTELGAMYPESGGMGRYAQYSHGPFAGVLASWSNWLSMLAIPPIEAVASVQYMAGWSFPWAKGLVTNGTLTISGLIASTLFMVLYTLLNFWTVALFAKSNTFITVFKLVVPLLTAVCLIAFGFHPGNFTNADAGGFAPFGWAAVFTGVATSGIVFSFNGFQSPINLAGEAQRPGRSVPFAVIGGTLLAGLVYILLQIAFIGAADPAALAAGGWGKLTFESPFAELAVALGLNWLALTLYADAVISPSGTGITYTATSARALEALQRSGYLPRWVGQLHPVFGVPRNAMLLNLALSLGALYLFPNWEALAAVVSVTCVVGFLTGPVSAMTLRRTAPNAPRPLRLRGLPLIAPIAFVFASLLVYWSRWPLNGQIMLLVLIGVPIYLVVQARRGWQDTRAHLRSGAWLFTYLLLMTMVSYGGSEAFGGRGWLPYGVDMLIVAVLAVAFYAWGLRSGDPDAAHHGLTAHSGDPDAIPENHDR